MYKRHRKWYMMQKKIRKLVSCGNNHKCVTHVRTRHIIRSALAQQQHANHAIPHFLFPRRNHYMPCYEPRAMHCAVRAGVIYTATPHTRKQALIHERVLTSHSADESSGLAVSHVPARTMDRMKTNFLSLIRLWHFWTQGNYISICDITKPHLSFELCSSLLGGVKSKKIVLM
jgi:hypothetical protein